MGFLDKVKSSMNLGGVKVQVVVQPASASEGVVRGMARLTAGSDDQQIQSLRVRFSRIERRYESYDRDHDGIRDSERKEHLIGETQVPCNFTLNEGESREVPFKVGFTPHGVGLVQQMTGSDNAFIRGMGQLAAMTSEPGEYKLTVTADTAAAKAMFDPSDTVSVPMMP